MILIKQNAHSMQIIFTTMSNSKIKQFHINLLNEMIIKEAS